MEGDAGAMSHFTSFPYILILFNFLIFCSHGQEVLPEKDRIFVFSQSTDKETQQAKSDPTKKSKLDEIVYVVRMPNSWNKDKDAVLRKDRLPSVRGVVCICTWLKTEAEFREKIVESETSAFKHIINFADENNLALLTWSNFGGYVISTSVDEMDKNEIRNYNAIFENRLSEWERGFKRVFGRYNLPKESALIYGFSGGGQIAHRIVLRRPQYFSGIHIHVNSSYDVPTANAKNIVWLVTTGELEYGYPSATRFYQSLIDMGCAVIFKAGENVRHATNQKIDALSVEFFKYMVTFMPDPTNPQWQEPPVDKFYLFRYPIYIGDYLNQVAYPVDNASVQIGDRKYMVPLPTKLIAEAWGIVIE